MENINPDYTFNVTKDGEFSTITYKKQHVSAIIMFPLALYAVLPAVIIASMIGESSKSTGFGIFVFFLFIIGIPALVLYLTNSGRSQGEIKVSKNNLVVDGKHYQLDHVATFLIKERKGADKEEITITNTGGMRGVSKGLGDALARQLNAAGYRIAIRYASKEIIIAKHLGELEVEALFRELTKLAGYTKNVQI